LFSSSFQTAGDKGEECANCTALLARVEKLECQRAAKSNDISNKEVLQAIEMQVQKVPGMSDNYFILNGP
jgi:hypothetical protein